MVMISSRRIVRRTVESCERKKKEVSDGKFEVFFIEIHLEVRLQEASGGGDDGRLEWTGNSDVRQKLYDVGC